MDADVARHARGALRRPTGRRPALETGHRQEGARGATQGEKVVPLVPIGTTTTKQFSNQKQKDTNNCIHHQHRPASSRTGLRADSRSFLRACFVFLLLLFFLRLFFLPLFFCYNTTIILDAFLSRTAGSPPESTNLHPLLLPFGSLRSSFVSFARKKHTLPHTHKRQKNYPSDESVMTFFPSAAVSVSRSTCPRRFIGFSIAVGSAQQTQKRRGTHLNHWS